MKKIVSLVLVIGLALAGLNAQGWTWADKKAKDDVDSILPGVNPLKVTGDVVSAGSSTVYPLAERIAARFKKEGYKGSINLASVGTGGGKERYLKGENDVANASSKYKPADIEAASKINQTTLELRIGTDALAVCVNKKNTFVKNATIEELGKIFTAEKWSDVNPAWPAEKILRFIPGTDSGTFEYFVEAVFAKKKEPLLNAPNTQKSEDDNILVQGIEGSPYAVGFFGYAYYSEEKSRLNILDIEGVTASADTVNKNTYKLSRPLFLYTALEILKAKPQVAAYLVYFLNTVNQEIKKVGYFPAHAEDLKASKTALLNAIKDYIK